MLSKANDIDSFVGTCKKVQLFNNISYFLTLTNYSEIKFFHHRRSHIGYRVTLDLSSRTNHERQLAIRHQTLLSFRLTKPSVISASDLSPLSAGSSASVLAKHLVTASICFMTRCIVRSVVSNLFDSSPMCLPAVE